MENIKIHLLLGAVVLFPFYVIHGIIYIIIETYKMCLEEGLCFLRLHCRHCGLICNCPKGYGIN